MTSGKFTAITAGAYHTCALDSGGAAYCWGYGGNGQLGTGQTSSSAVPIRVTTLGVLAGKTLTQITAGANHTCALDSGGAAYCWGYGGNGQLGTGQTSDSAEAIRVTTLGVLAGKTLTQISAGANHTCALDSGGAAYCWGYGGNGRLGTGQTSDSAVPGLVDTSGVLAGKTLTHISAGADHTCTLDSGGAAYCWGYGGGGQLGNGQTSDSAVPARVASEAVASPTLTQVTAGAEHTCALDSGGAAYCWGRDGYGQLGDLWPASSTVPGWVDTSGVLAGKTLTQITAGAYHTCALDPAGAAYCWGYGEYGQLGNEQTSNSTVPGKVTTSGVLAGKTLTRVTAGAYHTCALDPGGVAYCWGAGAVGRLGNGQNSDSTVPVQVADPV